MQVLCARQCCRNCLEVAGGTRGNPSLFGCHATTTGVASCVTSLVQQAASQANCQIAAFFMQTFLGFQVYSGVLQR